MTKHILVALPALALGLTACSADDPEPQKSADKPLGSGDISLTIPLASTRTGDDTSSLMNKMSIVAYDTGGHLIETIYKNGYFVKDKSGFAPGFDDVYEVNGYGTVMSLVLSNEIYGGFLEGKGYIQGHDDENSEDEYAHNHTGIQLVAFYLPDESTKFGDNTDDFDAPYDLNKLNSEIEKKYTLLFPADANGLFVPKDENQIPMSGALDITDAVTNYDPNLWNENNPMFLNHDPLVLIRSMAKITIENKDGFLTGASLKTAMHGTLMPDLESIVKEGNDTKVNKATVSKESHFLTDFDVDQSIAGSKEKYEFYTFERDLTGKSEDDNARKLITLEWEGHGKQTFSFKNYTSGNLSDPVWQGILRNHSYTFTVSKPDNGNIHVDVNVEKWDVKTYEDTY